MKSTHLSTFNIHDLSTQISVGGLVSTSTVPDLTAIYTLAEYKNNGMPIDGKVNIDYLFNYIIDDIAESSDNSLTIGRQIVIESDFQAVDNYKLISALFSNIGDTIEYDKLLEINTDVNATVESIKTELETALGLALSSVDNYNLCITKQTLDNAVSYVKTYSNKLFRNINQLIRVKRDWRLYGPGATISGNYLVDADSVTTHTTVPNSCFVKKTKGFISGNKPYSINTELTLGACVPNSVEQISPATLFSAAKHRHNITIKPPSNSTISASVDWWPPFKSEWEIGKDSAGAPTDATDCYLVQSDVSLSDYDEFGPHNPGQTNNNPKVRTVGITVGRTTSAKLHASVSLSYSSEKKYLASSGAALNTNIVHLPAYCTHVWQWKSDADDPTQLF